MFSPPKLCEQPNGLYLRGNPSSHNTGPQAVHSFVVIPGDLEPMVVHILFNTGL